MPKSYRRSNHSPDADELQINPDPDRLELDNETGMSHFDFWCGLPETR